MEDETPPPITPPPAPIAYAPLVAPIVLAAVANVIVPGMAKDLGPATRMGPALIVVALVVGAFFGEFGLIATWAVLGPWRLYAQWFVALLVGLGLFLAVVLGFSRIEPHASLPPWNWVPLVILTFLALLVAAQAPLWSIRLLRGWRLVFRGADAARTAIESRQLQIRDFLIVTTILAVFLGTMSFVAKRSEIHDGEQFMVHPAEAYLRRWKVERGASTGASSLFQPAASKPCTTRVKPAI